MLFSVADEISRQLSFASETQAGVFITTPICYPSGSTVVIRIDGTRDTFFVSDVGLGYQESMMINASQSYSSIARNLVRETGVSFDSQSFFVAKATRSDLTPIVAAVANFSQRAVIETLLKHEARKADRDRAILVSRLEGVFGSGHVEKDFGIRGASSVEWEVAARISFGNVVSIFDYAKPHKNSVVNAVAKFHDIARLPEAPRRIVTVADKAGMGDLLKLLSQAAQVISLAETPDDILKKLVA